MNVLPLLRTIASLEDLPRLAEALGCRPAWAEIPPSYWQRRPADSPPCLRSALIGHLGELPWYGLSSAAPRQILRRIAGLLLRRGEPAALLAVDPTDRALALSVAFEGVPVLSLVPEDDNLLAACLGKLPAITGHGRLGTAARLAEVLAIQGTGARFFVAFERQLDRMARCIVHRREEERRDLALLQLNRVLFLYFVQSKGWLDGKPDFLPAQVDRCLARGKRLDRHLLRPLFFGTLNRPGDQRTRTARSFGRIPFLNGGLFEPHPLERGWKGTIPNQVWREAFDQLFERFHFTSSEGTAGAIAPDMLGRVFEGVMVPEARKRSGTFYTPPALVRSLLEECLLVLLSSRLGVSAGQAESLLANRDPIIVSVLRRLTLLDPAVGSGAFLLAALERLSELSTQDPVNRWAERRRILQSNLFGVDVNPTAVRLTELRLWLSVIAGDPASDPGQVAPLPNLDCLVRQGDSLTDPLGLIARMPFRAGGMGQALAGLRLAFSGATGTAKRAAAHTLRRAEARAMRECLELAERVVQHDIEECLSAARAPDLFGARRGADRIIRSRLRELRRRVAPIRQARRRLEQEGEIGWFQYESHFADVFSTQGGFDVVVGNPPWVRAEKLAPSVREHLAGRYRWWRGEGEPGRGFRHQPDLSVAFLERSHELAAPGGVVGLLVPAKLTTVRYATAARRALARDLTLHAVCDLGDSFPAAFDATVYPMALVTEKARPQPDQPVRLALACPTAPTVTQSGLAGGGPWIMRSPEAADIARDLARYFPTVASRHSIRLGVKTGANAIFLDPPGTVEPELIRQAFRGRDVQPFRIATSLRLLWPCDEGGCPLEHLPAGALAHFTAHRKRLESRADYRGGPPWVLFRTGPAAPGARVVWADLSQALTAAALEGTDHRIALNTCYVICTAPSEADPLAAWFNSSWMRGLARLQADPASNGFARYNARAVGALPLPPSVSGNRRLAQFARQAATGHYLQAELDELTASHLDLPATALKALASVA